jgi:hypothetical protein
MLNVHDIYVGNFTLYYVIVFQMTYVEIFAYFFRRFHGEFSRFFPVSQVNFINIFSNFSW